MNPLKQPEPCGQSPWLDFLKRSLIGRGPLLPGTELAFGNEVQYDRVFRLFRKARVDQRVARFQQVKIDNPNVHHDALEFPADRL
jgi:hypothetical protein